MSGSAAGATDVAVGVRLPMPGPGLGPRELLAISRAAVDVGFGHLWMGEHVALPNGFAESHPSTQGRHLFDADSSWPDPFVTLSWLAATLDGAATLGTSVLILPLRNTVVAAKQLTTLSWLVGGALSIGLGTSWLRGEYEIVGARFDGRGARVGEQIARLRRLLDDDVVTETFLRADGENVTHRYGMRPRPAGPIELLWGGRSPLALKIVASCCDGWLPTKYTWAELESERAALRRACDELGRDPDSVQLVGKPGPGPDPVEGAIDAASLERYATLGFRQVVLELPLGVFDVDEHIDIIRRVARRCG